MVEEYEGGRVLVFVIALVSVILTELCAAVTQPHGLYIFRNALLDLFYTSIGSVGCVTAAQSSVRMTETKAVTKTNSTLRPPRKEVCA